MNWGLRITILYVAFAIMILFLVYRSMDQKIDLVSPDYYAKELSYQEKIDKINNTKELTSSPEWQVQENGLQIQFPEEMNDTSLHGEIVLFRPSTSSLDKRLIISPDPGGAQFIPRKELEKGMYQIQIDWQAGGRSFYKEGVIIIP